MRDEIAFVPGLTRSAAELDLQGRQRTNPAGELDQHAPEDRWNVHPHHVRPAKDQKAAEHDEQDEQEVEEDDEVGQTYLSR
jgi:hypothetical protein